MKKLFLLSLWLLCLSFLSCGGGNECLPNKSIGDVIVVNKQTLGAMDRATFNKMIDAAVNKNDAATIEMMLAGQVRMIPAGMRGTLKDKDETRALLQLPDDDKAWWIVAEFLE